MRRRKELTLMEYPKTELERQLRVYAMSLYVGGDLHKKLHSYFREDAFAKEFCAEAECECLRSEKQQIYLAMMAQAFHRGDYLQYLAVPILLEKDENFENEIRKEFIKKCNKYFKKVQNVTRNIRTNDIKHSDNAEKLSKTFWIAEMIRKELDCNGGSTAQHIVLTFYAIANCEELFNGGYKLDMTAEDVQYGFDASSIKSFSILYILHCLEFAGKLEEKGFLDEYYNTYKNIYENKLNMYYAANRFPSVIDDLDSIKDKVTIIPDEEHYNKNRKFYIGIGVHAEYNRLLEDFLVANCKKLIDAGANISFDTSRKNIRAMIASSDISAYAEDLRAIERLTIECILTGHRLSDKISSNSQVEQKIEKLEREVRRKQNKVDQLRTENTKEKEKVTKLESQVRKLEKGKQEIDTNSKLVEELRKEVEQLKKENRNLSYNEGSLKSEISRLKNIVGQKESEVEELSDKCVQLEEMLESVCDDTVETVNTESLIEEIETMLGGRRLFVIGGTTASGERFVSNFKYAVHKTLNETAFDDVTDKDYVVLSVLQMKHKLSKPLIDRCRALGIKYTYISNSNTDKILQKIHTELKAEKDNSSGIYYNN